MGRWREREAEHRAARLRVLLATRTKRHGNARETPRSVEQPLRLTGVSIVPIYSSLRRVFSPVNLSYHVESRKKEREREREITRDLVSLSCARADNALSLPYNGQLKSTPRGEGGQVKPRGEDRSRLVEQKKKKRKRKQGRKVRSCDVRRDTREPAKLGGP